MNSDYFVFASLILIFLGIVLLSISLLLSKNTEVEWGFVGIVGFIPVVFGSSKKAVIMALLLTIILLIALLLIFNIRT